MHGRDPQIAAEKLSHNIRKVHILSSWIQAVKGQKGPANLFFYASLVPSKTILFLQEARSHWIFYYFPIICGVWKKRNYCIDEY